MSPTSFLGLSQVSVRFPLGEPGEFSTKAGVNRWFSVSPPRRVCTREIRQACVWWFADLNHAERTR